MSILVIGSTGTLGRQIVRCALNDGYEVKCLVRNLRKAFFLQEWGAELLYGDLSIPETLPDILKDITVIIDASTTRPTDILNMKQIDWEGKLALFQAAEVSQIDRNQTHRKTFGLGFRQGRYFEGCRRAHRERWHRMHRRVFWRRG